MLNYVYTDAGITDDANKNYIGLSTLYRVRHIQNTWMNYKLPFKITRGITISAGYQLQTGRAGRYPQDGHLGLANIFRVDGGIGWTNVHLSRTTGAPGIPAVGRIQFLTEFCVHWS
ncbi:hypothetical protein CK934_25515 [Chitinophaga sp. MD30]|nr:hypothetical protein CK934_25515 [Chitinophaga sp. MD30]